MRGGLARRLQERGLWISREQQGAILFAHKTAGRALKRGALKELLGPGDYDFLHGEVAFGFSGRRCRRSLPPTLSFGHSMGLGFAAYLAVDEASRRDAAMIGAWFNLMIMMFDRTFDNVTGGPEDLLSVFDEDTMRRLAEAPEAMTELADAAARHPRPEIRISLKVAAAFYGAVHVRARGTDTKLWRRLHELLRDAYRAEIHSVYDRNPRERAAASRATKIIPFEIICNAAMLGEAPLTAREDALAAAAAQDIGTVFWLSDDLADLVRDLREGAANSIACAGQDFHALALPDDNEELWRRLATGPFIADAVDRLADSLENVVIALDAVRPARIEVRQFRDFVLAFVRGWSD